MKNKKGLILSIIGIITLILITGGVTYAFFNYAKEGTTDNVITTGSITFLYTEVSGVGNGINIENAFPISDEVGKVQTGDGEYFDFKITSKTGNNAIPYEVTARKSSTSDDIDEYIRVYLTKVDGTEEEILLDNYNNLTQTEKVLEDKYTEKTIYTDEVPANTEYEQNFRLRMWLDEDTRFDNVDMNNKTFTLTVNVYANARVVTEEEIAYESNTNISTLSVEATEMTKVESEDYDYEATLPEGTTSAIINVETENPNAIVLVEKLTNIANSNNVTRLAATNQIDLVDGYNYFKITIISENKKETEEYIIKIRVGLYYEEILNGTDPVLTDNLIPVKISNTGVVTKASLSEKWYSYEDKEWANAVVLKNNNAYSEGQEIPESNIESYFVWIPKYSYQLWDLGNYSSVTSLNKSNIHTIPIKFGLTNTSDTVTGECTTPGIAGESGNCVVGDYMTHPAFQAFDTNGLWVGKFETGYDGATSSEDARIISSDSSKIIIKPNAYSWRSNKLGNMFEASINYLTDDNSHMMKNTEWGAVAYLHYSQYGAQTGVRVNNNSYYITGYSGVEEPTAEISSTSIEGNRFESVEPGSDGQYTNNYFNTTSTISSTTGNYTGVYDMSGGASEITMGYTIGATNVGGNSTITSIYEDFYTNTKWDKYYDKYTSTVNTNYNNRILGDATGEMGPFEKSIDSTDTTRYRSSWNDDVAHFVNATNCWLNRGGYWSNGYFTGIFAFTVSSGAQNEYLSYRKF